MKLSRVWRRRGVIGFSGVVAFVCLCLLSEYTTPAKRGDHAIQDLLLANWTPVKPAEPPNVVLVTITESTLASLPYRSPIDRGLLANVADIVAAAGATAIAFDILVDQATEAEKDQMLADAISRLAGRAVVAWADHRGGLLEQQSAWLNNFIAKSGAIAGFANLTTDADGVVRRFENRLPDTENLSLAAAVAKAAGLDVGNRMSGRIIWRQSEEGAQAFPTIPANGLLVLARVRPQALKALLGGKIVLVGADLPLVDRHTSSLASSLSPAIPKLTAGVEIHAHIVDQMHRNVFLETWTDTYRYVLLALLALAVSFLALLNIHFLLKCLGLIVVVGGYAAFAIWALYELLILSPLIQPTVISLTMFVLTLSGSTLYLSSDRRFIRTAFGRYVSPKIVTAMVDDPDLLTVGGERRELSFIFTDIAGFTSLSEAISPERLTQLLNDYLGGMSDLVVKHDGIVDKFIGDAVVAIFGAPLDDPQHRQNALNCALEMNEFCQSFIKTNSDIDMGITRIGVHSGDAIVGNFGSELRYDYTAMGDTMNIAARLEGANKYFGTRLAVSASTMQSIAEGGPGSGSNSGLIDYDGAYLLHLGDVIFKGKRRPISVYTNLVHSDESWATKCHQMIEAIGKNADTATDITNALFDQNADEPIVSFHKARLDRDETGLEIELRDK